MKIAVSNEVMRYSDKMTIDGGVPSRELMRRAGEGIFKSARDRWGAQSAVVCGGGNNGGDGYVLALYLKQSGVVPTLVLADRKFSPDGEFYFEKCKKEGIEHVDFTPDFDFSPFDSIADCIFGTGFRGEICGNEKLLIEKINDSGKFIVSADINSGIHGNGSFSGVCVRSNLTVAIGFYKFGHFLGLAKDHIKELACIDIGIKLFGDAAKLPEIFDFADVLSERAHNSHKGSYGYTAIIGGCLEYSGAIKLANLAACAMRCGCGVTKLACAKTIAPAVSVHLLESTLFPIDDVNGHMLFDAAAFSLLVKGTSAISCGMGWGKSFENEKILIFLLQNYGGKLIIDADGLNTLSRLGDSVLCDIACQSVVLTPHPLEFSRISGYTMQEIFEDPVRCAKEYVSRFDKDVVLLLKGASTVVCDKNECYIVNRGCPGMATAGSGDVLSGILTGLLGYAAADAKSVACGAYIAGLAGEMAGEEYGNIPMIASDTVKYIPAAISALTKAAEKKEETDR